MSRESRELRRRARRLAELEKKARQLDGLVEAYERDGVPALLRAMRTVQDSRKPFKAKFGGSA